MARIYKLKVPNENMISRIISSENQAHEIMVIDRSDKAFINTYIEKLEKPALYILVNRETDKLYIGETEDSIKRLRNHESKEFWTEAIVFHSKMNTLSTTEVRWLEAKTYEVVKELGYFDLSENKVKPNYPPLKEDQDLELQPVFEEAKRYICAAGFDIFLKKRESKNQKEPEEVKDENFMVFHQELKKAGGSCKMTYYPNSKKFVLNKGTNIVAETNDSCGKGAMVLRKAIIKSTKLSKKEGELFTLIQDIELPSSLSSPSGASKICWGTSRPGPDDWKDENGNKYPTEWWKGE